MEGQPYLVYFSSTTHNTQRFVERLGVRSARIPLLPKEALLEVHEPYVLVVPTYGGGSIKGAVPKQVIKFLNVKENRDLCRGVITSGNINFGEAYGLAGDIVAAKLEVPLLYRFELMGTQDDVETVTEGLRKLWQKL